MVCDFKVITSDLFSDLVAAAFLHKKTLVLFLDVKESDQNEDYSEVSALWRMWNYISS